MNAATVIFVVVAALGGCGEGLTGSQPTPSRLYPTAQVTLAGSLFRATMPTADYAPTPLVFGDDTGLVKAIEPVQQSQPFDPVTKVQAQPSDANSLILSWLGGACESQIDVEFSRTGVGYSAAIESHREPGLCPAVGIPHALRIELTTPVAPSEVLAVGD